MKNKLKSSAAFCLAFVYLFVLSSVNSNAFDFKFNSDNGKQAISASLSSQLFSHSSEKGNSLNEFSQANSSFKGHLSLSYLGFYSIEFIFQQHLKLFVKQASNTQLSYQRLIRLFPYHCFL